MPIAGYLGQDDLGGHTFQLDDGTTLYTPDMPEARQLAAQLGQAPDLRTAQAAPPGPDLRPDAPPAPEPAVADVPQPSGATGQEPGVMRSGAIAAGVPVLNPPTLPTLPGARAPGQEAPLLSPAEEAMGTGPAPYTPPVTVSDLQRKAASGVAVPTTQAVEVSGAVPMDPALAAAQAHAFRTDYDVHQALANRDIQTADAQAEAAKAQRIHWENQAIFAEAHQRRIEQEAEAKTSAIRQFDEEAQARYQDFGAARFFKKQGAWATIGSAIAQALGAYGAALAHTDNFAAKIIDSAIQDDIEAQRQEYLRDRDARNNLVADLARATGDVDAATDGAKAIQWNIAQAHGAEVAALSGKEDAQKAWALYQPQFEQRVVDYFQKAHEKALGNTVLKTNAAVAYPHAGGGGGAPTLAQIDAAEGHKTSIAEKRAKRRELGGGGASELEIAPGVYARNRDEAKDQRAALEKHEDLDRALADLEKQTEEHGTAARVGGARYPFTSKAISPQGASIDSKKKIVSGKISSTIASSGTLNADEYPRYKAALDTPDGIRGLREEIAISKRAILEGHSKKPLPAAPREAK